MDLTPHTALQLDELSADGVSPQAISLDQEIRVRRLAEMVQHLTDCPPDGALHAVKRSLRKAPSTADEALDIVARAIVGLKHGIDLRDQIELD